MSYMQYGRKQRRKGGELRKGKGRKEKFNEGK